MVMILVPAPIAGQEVPRAESTLVPIKVLYEAQQSGIGRALRVVLSGDNGRAEFVQLWREVHGRSTSMPSLPIVDFKREMVILAAMGFEASIGSRIAIADVRHRSHALEVTVELRPFCGRNGYPMVTNPIVIVCVPFTLSTVVFQDHIIQTRC